MKKVCHKTGTINCGCEALCLNRLLCLALFLSFRQALDGNKKRNFLKKTWGWTQEHIAVISECRRRLYIKTAFQSAGTRFWMHVLYRRNKRNSPAQSFSGWGLLPLCFEVRLLCWVASGCQNKIWSPCESPMHLNSKLRLFLPSGAAVFAFAERPDSGNSAAAFRFSNTFQKRDNFLHACVVPY